MQLVREAERTLKGATGPGSGNSARLAAFVARQAVEAVVDNRLKAVGAECPIASMRSRLAVLKSLDGHERTAQLELVWSQLYACCHQHAYELAPTVSEMRTLCGTVLSLSAV
ncbi:MAG: hypothetical protein DI630_09350 [Gordonia sp. (in: high G+C Gram-positive bacteria)]|nr:MAG: hypothetical protein DI630_09350 [Gordonia sp. (in: high G+C Gram-positive bacteria)]